MQFRTKVTITKLLSAWDANPTAKFRFNEVQKTLGWTSRRLAFALSRAVAEGYLGKQQVNGVVVYHNKIANYKGYFDALDFLKKVDESCRKSGKFQSVEQHLYTFSPFHILAYGIARKEELTPLEDELLFSTFARLVHAFSDFAHLCDDIEKRQEIERELPLPETVKVSLFAREKDDKTPLPNLNAVHEIYGDALWEHVFNKLVYDIRFALEKASLDYTGPIEILNCSDRFVKLALKTAKQVYEGKLSEYADPDPKTTQILQELRIAENPFRESSHDVALVVTPSPQTMDEYAISAGKIIGDALEVWGKPDELIDKIIEKKGSDFWDDSFKDGRGRTKTRREKLRTSLINDLTLMRDSEAEPLSKVDKKLMLEDSQLRKVFSKEEIQSIIDSVENLIMRSRKFLELIENGVALKRIKQDKEWFTKNELFDYKIAEDVEESAWWRKQFGHSGPVTVEFPPPSKEHGKLVNAYQTKVRDELRKRKFVGVSK